MLSCLICEILDAISIVTKSKAKNAPSAALSAILSLNAKYTFWPAKLLISIVNNFQASWFNVLVSIDKIVVVKLEAQLQVCLETLSQVELF